MKTMRWFLMVGFALLVGFFLIQYMVRPTDQIGMYAVLLMISIVGLGIVLFRSFKGKEFLLAGLIVLAGSAIGYVTANAAFLAQEEETRTT